MKLTTTTLPSLLTLALTASATYQCPASPSSADSDAVTFALSIQTLLANYYAAVPINSSFYSTLPSPTMPMTDFLANTMGLAVQADLGVQGLQQLADMAGASMPSCDFAYPPVTDAESHLMNAYMLEATLCGAFIGLAEYVQSPQAAFLMARLSAEHGIHASYIGSHMKAVVFPSNSTMLTPAFTPQMVSISGMGVGFLGAYLNDCVAPPAAPCGGNVTIGELGAELSGMNVMPNGTMGTGMSPTMSAVPFMGGAERIAIERVAAAVAVGAGVVAWMLV